MSDRLPRLNSMRAFAALLLVPLVVARAPRCQTSADLSGLQQTLAQPGPEGRIAREAAIETLLSRTDAGAHDLLRDIVRRGPSPDGVALAILSQLRRKLANADDPVFGHANRELAIGRGYVRALAALFTEREPLDEAARRLRSEARLCVGALTAADRHAAFQELLASEDAGLRRGAMALAGVSRDLGLAPMLAAALDNGEWATEARDALARLTFVDSFATKAQFDLWWEEHDDSSYLQLAEAAAQRARDVRSAALQRAEARATEALAELVEALASRENVAWTRIADRILADDPPGSMRVCLERLRDLLAKAPKHGGVAVDRLALLQRLQAMLTSAPPSADLHAVLLEVCAYLVAPGEDKAAEEVCNLLRVGLEHESPVVRRAAVLGYARFPSVDASRLLVRTGVRARESGELTVLAAVFASLAAPGHLAPDKDTETFPAWLQLVDGVLRDLSLPESLREAAVAVLDQRGAQGKRLAQVLSILAAVTQDSRQAPVVRERAAVSMMPYATEDANAAVTLVDTLTGVLTDPEKRMRLKGAQLLQNVPKHREAAERWRGQVLRHVGEVLAKETDEVVLRALITTLERQVDPERPDLEPVISRLCLAVQELARTGVFGPRRQILVSALAGQAATQGLATMHWVRAAETLLQLGERREVRNVLDRQRPLALLERPDKAPDAIRAALECMVRTALLKPPAEPWSENELKEVLAALTHLDSLSTEPRPPEWSLLRIDVLLAAGQFDDALQRCKAELEGNRLQPAERERVRLALFRAHLGRGEVEEAQRVCSEHFSAAAPAVLAQMHEETGLALLRLDRPKEALTSFVEAQQRTPESDPAFPRRLLRRLDAEGRAEPEAREQILTRLLARETLFTGADASAEMRAEFDRVKTRLSRKP